MSLFDRDKSAERMPVSLITGFLGSGKTTLLNRLLRHPGMSDSAVIVNEFGEIGLDHLLMQPAVLVAGPGLHQQIQPAHWLTLCQKLWLQCCWWCWVFQI